METCATHYRAVFGCRFRLRQHILNMGHHCAKLVLPILIPTQVPPNPMPYAAPLVDDLNYMESASELPEEVHGDWSIEMLNEIIEVG